MKMDTIEIIPEKEEHSEASGSFGSNEEVGHFTHQQEKIDFNTPMPPDSVNTDEMNMLWRKTTELLKT